MALITCEDCGHQVSPRAVACPSCGGPINPAPVPAHSSSQNDTWGKVAIGVGAWLVTPWIARIIAVIVFAIVAIVLFSRG